VTRLELTRIAAACGVRKRTAPADPPAYGPGRSIDGRCRKPGKETTMKTLILGALLAVTVVSGVAVTFDTADAGGPVIIVGGSNVRGR
jgi:hypothetical protein